jgi:energy-coupling factor transporter transmembrane protein EcfT
MGSLLMLIGFYWDIRFMLPIAITALILVLIAGVPKSWLYAAGGIMIALIPITIIGIVTQVNPDLFKVYPREFITSLSFIFTIPYMGSFGLTWGGILWGLANEIRIPVVLFLVYSFLYSTSISDLVQALSKTRVPNSLIFVIMVAYKFVPEMWRKLRTITTALRLRGWGVKSRNPVKLVKRMTPLAYSMGRSQSPLTK